MVGSRPTVLPTTTNSIPTLQDATDAVARPVLGAHRRASTIVQPLPIDRGALCRAEQDAGQRRTSAGTDQLVRVLPFGNIMQIIRTEYRCCRDQDGGVDEQGQDQGKHHVNGGECHGLLLRNPVVGHAPRLHSG